MPPNTPQSDQFSQLADRIKSATNILVTVSNNPSVDQLAACIGLTVALNKQGKHATAVYSGKTPSTIEFLHPDATIETNTNSLRDFIIALDKSKADKLRYKVEDNFVKIFITPYRTSISQDDLNFSQGDFNIDLIVTLGVKERNDLDQAIISHGRILHDATVASINTNSSSELGTINWLDSNASSLCEMVTDLVLQLDKSMIDPQIATALLTGMVAETDRFGNEKARPHTMSISGVLMAAGASPQLISGKLSEGAKKEEAEKAEAENAEEQANQQPSDEIPQVAENDGKTEEPAPPEEPKEEPKEEPAEEPKNNDGTIEIDHDGLSNGLSMPPAEEEVSAEDKDNIHIDDEGKLRAMQELEEAEAQIKAMEAKDSDKSAEQPAPDAELSEASNQVGQVDQRSLVLDPPKLGGRLTANDQPENYSPTSDPMSSVSPKPLLDRTMPQKPASGTDITPPETGGDQTLSDIEKSVNSMHLNMDNGSDNSSDKSDALGVPPPPPVDDARAAVEQAAQAAEPVVQEPINALGAQPVDLDLGHNGTAPTESTDEPPTVTSPSDQNNNSSNNVPPPVPPPLMPPGV